MANEKHTDNSARKAWMSLMASAPEAAMMALLDAVEDKPKFDWLRAPEVGGVMVQGRMGGTGASFNVGEMTMTRCTLVLEDGTVGHGYVQGRSKPKAEAAALIDALMQTEAADRVQRDVLSPLAGQVAQTKTERAARAAATKVEFFTMVRGED